MREMTEERPKRPHKDTVFRMLFKEKENLLSLYNAVNGTAYTDMGELKVTTLENAVYMNYKNDVSFVFNFELMLYEHQSTVNPNMPLRSLVYVTKILQGLTRDADLYGPALVKIPTPRFVVFYNGMQKQPEQKVLKLSDAFEKQAGNPELEVLVAMYNINLGQNQQIMESCQALKEYAQFVDKVRGNAKTEPLAEAVEAAVDECIKKGILADFLKKNRAEAIAMSIFEYDEEKHLKNEREHAYNEGKAEGRAEGRAEGKAEGRMEEIVAMGREFGLDDAAILQKLQEKTGLSMERAIAYLERYGKQPV